MRARLRLLLDYFTVNYARERRNFSRLFLVLLCIFVALLGLDFHSRFISEWQSAKHIVPFIIAYSISLFLFVAVITTGLQIILAFFLAHSLAFRRAHALDISVGEWDEVRRLSLA